MIKFCSGNFGRIKYLINELKNSEDKNKINQLIEDKKYNGINRDQYKDVVLNYLESKIGAQKITESECFPTHDGKHELTFKRLNKEVWHSVAVDIDHNNNRFLFFDPNSGIVEFNNVKDMKNFFFQYIKDRYETAVKTTTYTPTNK